MNSKDAYYFPHFSNARNDRKIKRVRKVLHGEGYAIFFMLLEILREQEDYSYPLKDIDLLADDFRTSEEKVNAVIFNFELFEVRDDKFFFSAKLIEYLQPWIQKKHRLKINGIKGNLIRHGHASKKQLQNMTDTEILALNKKITGFSPSDRLAIPGRSQRSKESNQSDQSKKESEEEFPPPLPEVIKFFRSNNGEKKSAQNFFDHFQATGWMMGSSPLRDWKARARKWIREDKEHHPVSKSFPEGGVTNPETPPNNLERVRGVFEKPSVWNPAQREFYSNRLQYHLGLSKSQAIELAGMLTSKNYQRFVDIYEIISVTISKQKAQQDIVMSAEVAYKKIKEALEVS